MDLNVICTIMAMNNDYSCLILNRALYERRNIFYLQLNKKNKNRLFRKAIKHNKFEIIKFLVKYVDDVTDCKYIFYYPSVFKFLVDNKKIDLHSNNNFVLKYAGNNGYCEILAILLNYIDPSIDNNYLIRYSCLYANNEIVEILLDDDRVDPTADNNYCVKIACLYKNDIIIDLLANSPKIDKAILAEECSRYKHFLSIRSLLESQ